LPKGREDWRIGTGVSLLLHIAVLVALLLPLAATTDLREIEQGAGGPGPAGGGGGGTLGTGMDREALRFVRIAPPPAAAPVPTPAVKPPPPVVPPETKAEPQVKLVETAAPIQPVGTGGGSGSDNTAGSGPGSGGGVGSGVGPGRGSAVGPGTGGGGQANYPPAPIEMFIPPLPVPSSVKGFHLIAEFDIDEKGRVLAMTFGQTPDRGYNRRLADVLRGYRFRPGTQLDGTPVRMKFQLVVDLY
jgi:hypothetical protein